MAYLPGHAPTSLGYTPPPKKKKPKPPTKPTGSFDPSNSLGGYTPKEIASMTPDQIAMVQFGLRMQGAPEPDFEKLRAIAQSQVAGAYEAPQQAIGDEREWLRGNYDLSTQAATNFSKAFADILTGGKSGAEGEQYSLENFGGSYLAGIAARMGQQLISQQTSYFNEEDRKLKDQLADIMEAMPEEAEKIYSDLVENTQDILSAGYKEQLAAWAALEVAKRKSTGGDGAPETKNFSDGTTRQWNPKTGKWDVVASESAAAPKPRIFQTSEGVFAIDEATGQVVWEKKTGKAKTKKVTTQVVEQPDGSKVLIDKATGREIRVVAPPDASAGAPATSNGKAVSPSTASNTVKRATEAGATALEKVTDAIWAKMPGSGAEQGTPEYAKAEAAYQAWLDSGKSFGTAMQRVIVSISPHLKAIGYTPSQIRRAAYDIVSAELDPPKGYKPPKAKAARAAANNVAVVTPKTGVVTASPWKGTHITDGLDWNHGQQTAVDIMADPDDPVGAPEDGTIVRWGSAQGGQALYFQGVSGKRYWLGHIDNMLPVGTRVQANQQIATISRDHPRPHLHIDVTGGAV